MRRLLRTLSLLLLLAAPLAAESLIARGDEIFATRTPSGGAAEALTLYEEAAQNPANAEAHWKAARALHWLGEYATKADKRKFYERGIVFGEKAVALAPDLLNARFWLGALYGSYGEARGVRKSLKMLKPIRLQMDEIVRRDERWNGAAGLRVLGIVDYKVPGIAGGSKKRAAERLSRALEIDGANPFNHYYMAEFLAESGKGDEALVHLKRVSEAGPSPDVDAPDLAMIQKKAAALEKKIAG